MALCKIFSPAIITFSGYSRAASTLRNRRSLTSTLNRPGKSATQGHGAAATEKAGPEARSDAQQPQKKKEGWQIQKEALRRKFSEGWHPRKRLSPDTLDTIREQHAVDPVRFSTPALADLYAVSPEAIRRILKNKWRPRNEEERRRREERWRRREARLWSHQVELGLRPERPELAWSSDARILDQTRSGHPGLPKSNDDGDDQL